MGTLRVLVVDDDAYVRPAIARYLESRGFDVTVAESFRTAVELSDRYDVATLDIELGDGNGLELADELLRTGRVGRVVFLTGLVDGDLVRRAASLGPVFVKGEADVLRRLADALHGKERAQAFAVGCGDVSAPDSTPRSGPRAKK